MAGLTYDAGALIALERRETRAWAWHRRATERGEVPTVPVVVVAETWRGGYSLLRDVLDACRIEPLTDALARLAGVALGSTHSSETVDAIVAASAAQRDDVLLTTDASDLLRFADFFRGLRIVAL